MKITVIPTMQVKPAERNVRMHPQKQISELMRSIRMFGQTRAIIVDENYSILAGNGLFAAMQQLGYTEVECYVMTGLTEQQKKKLMLADNRIYELGMMDMDAFDDFIKEINDADIPGWDEELIKTLTSSAPEIDNIIGDYGTFPAEQVQTMNNRQHDDYAPPAAEAPAYSMPAPAPQPIPVQQPAQESAAPVQRYIICPKCGEKICL